MENDDAVSEADKKRLWLLINRFSDTCLCESASEEELEQAERDIQEFDTILVDALLRINIDGIERQMNEIQRTANMLV